MSRIAMFLSIVVALSLSAGVSVLAFAQEGSGGSDLGTGDSVGSTSEPVVEALDQQRSADDALPETAVAELGMITGPEPDSASSVKALEGGSLDLYLTPAPDGACLSIADETGGSSVHCYTRESLEAGAGSPAGAVLQGCDAPSPDAAPVCQNVVLYGVVPDGVEQVSVDVEAGSSASAPVENNAYLVELPLSSRPNAVSYTSDEGTTEQQLPPLGG
jgi:hypothetical protein